MTGSRGLESAGLSARSLVWVRTWLDSSAFRVRWRSTYVIRLC